MYQLDPQVETKFDACGIEVSARQLTVRLRRQGRNLPQRTFDNTPSGHQELLRWLGRSGRPIRVCVEATGRYSLDLCLTLHQARLSVMVANPRAVRHFAEALMRRSKNDRLDTDVLCEFAARMPFQPWRPPSLLCLRLVALARRLEDLTEMIVAERNRLHAASVSQALPRVIRLDVTRSIAHQQKALERHILTKSVGTYAPPAGHNLSIRGLYVGLRGGGWEACVKPQSLKCTNSALPLLQSGSQTLPFFISLIR